MRTNNPSTVRRTRRYTTRGADPAATGDQDAPITDVDSRMSQNLERDREARAGAPPADYQEPPNQGPPPRDRDFDQPQVRFGRRDRDRDRDRDDLRQDRENVISAQGVLEILPDGWGFLRRNNFSPSGEDIPVAETQIKPFSLHPGDSVLGQVPPPKDSEKFFGLLRVEQV